MEPVLVIAIALVLAAAGIYYVYTKKVPNRTFTLEELSKYDGNEFPRCLAVGGLVFDVNKSESYRKGQPYECFVGKDISVPLGRMDMNPGLLNSKEQLTLQQQKTLQEWVTYFKKRYSVMGRLSN